MGTILETLIYELKTKRLEFPLTIIYGNLATVSECYLVANRILGPLQYEPLNSSPIAANRMFTQFHAEYPEFERERIVKELVAGTSKLRLLFVTIAFGIGVDIKDIRSVIHIGVPHTVEKFFQEAGRRGGERVYQHHLLFITIIFLQQVTYPRIWLTMYHQVFVNEKNYCHTLDIQISEKITFQNVYVVTFMLKCVNVMNVCFMQHQKC